MSVTNFLIGRGELLTHDIRGPRRSLRSVEVYNLEQSIQRLSPQFEKTVEIVESLPREACPGDFSVARLTMNPSYIARSYFPASLLRSVGLESVGSRTVKVTPGAWKKQGKPTECATTEIFVVGKRNAFRSLQEWAHSIEEKSPEALDLGHIESFAAFTAEDRIADLGTPQDHFFELGLHLLPEKSRAFVQQAFVAFANGLGVNVHAGLSFVAGNLWFVPVEGTRAKIRKLADFVLVRVVRPVPKLRAIRSAIRSGLASVTCELPAEQPLSSEPRVAILDAGLPKTHPIEPWLRSYRESDPVAAPVTDGEEHGLSVTSAFLFGPIDPNGKASRPYSYVDHVRVYDNNAEDEDPLELYRTLGFVEEVLLSRQYEFINLSLGPKLSVVDTDVHAWTSVIDDLLSDGNTFMTVAVGNNGQKDPDPEVRNDRVQVPSDCVNAVAVGSSDDLGTTWSRAPYSAIGPGRSPGIIKPDLLAFGGSPPKYFHVLAPGKKARLYPDFGTSIAAPYLLRNAVGIRAILGSDLSALAIKALLVHAADPLDHHHHEVGWGKIPEDLMSIVTCPEGVARVVYQGELKPGKYLRAPLPLPPGGLSGMVELRTTFCYASPTDPQDAASYTRAGLEVTFRPNSDNVKDGKSNAETKGFFDLKKFALEDERRSDWGKWETVLHGKKRMRGTSLNEAVFDIHYNAREAGGATSRAEKIRYALIVTIEAQKHPDLYNEILRAYSKLLVPIQPHVSLPIRI